MCLFLFWKEAYEHFSVYLVQVTKWACCHSWAYRISLFQKTAPGSAFTGEPHEHCSGHCTLNEQDWSKTDNKIRKYL